MAFSFREPGLLVSGVAHVALLAAGLVAFTGAAPFPDADEGIPVEFITENQFSEITRGETDAAETAETPAPRAERIAETAALRPPGEAARDAPSPPTRTADTPVAEAPVEAAQAPPPPAVAPTPPPPPPVAEREPPPPEPAAAIDPAPAEAAEPPEPSVAESAPLPPSPTDRAQAQRAAQALAQARAADERKRQEAARQEAARQEAARQENQRQEAARQERTRKEAEAKRLAEAKAREEREALARREAETAERFNPGDIAALLRTTEEPQSRGASGAEINRTASLGTATGTAARLNPSQRDALIGIIQSQLRRCWDAPIAAQSAPNPPVASVRFALNVDGSLAGQPQVINDSADPLFQAVADSATRATRRCAPLQIPAQFAPYYEDWKNMTVNFNPHDA